MLFSASLQAPSYRNSHYFILWCSSKARGDAGAFSCLFQAPSYRNPHYFMLWCSSKARDDADAFSCLYTNIILPKPSLPHFASLQAQSCQNPHYLILLCFNKARDGAGAFLFHSLQAPSYRHPLYLFLLCSSEALDDVGAFPCLSTSTVLPKPSLPHFVSRQAQSYRCPHCLILSLYKYRPTESSLPHSVLFKRST